jgi:hypothetical protein
LTAKAGRGGERQSKDCRDIAEVANSETLARSARRDPSGRKTRRGPPWRPSLAFGIRLATGAIYALIAVGFTLLWELADNQFSAFFILAAMNAGAPF